MNVTFQQWMQQGDAMYQNALKEFHAIEAQLEEMEGRLVAKQAEVNQIAQVLGKPPVELTRKAAGPAVAISPVAPNVMEEIERSQSPSSHANIARALAGRFGR